MLMQTLGSIGTGLVWGWLVARLGGTLLQPWRSVSLILAATLALALVIYVYADWVGLTVYLGAAALAFLFHSVLRAQLK